ncbi:MAG: type IIL restriction-modification enzyme MmeI [Polyangiaceae bacterium]
MRGRDGDVQFAREMIAAFGWTKLGAKEDDTSGLEQADGLEFGKRFQVASDGKRSARTVTAAWPSRRVVLDVAPREQTLDLAYKELLHTCLQMETEPQYVVLTNQRDLRLYDLARDRSEARLTISVDELPKYSEAFPFFLPDWQPGATPKIINVEKVTKEVADLVAKVYRALRAKNPGRDADVIRFTLQCIIAMFAEDIGLLPKEYFTTLLYEGAETGDTQARLESLSCDMATEKKRKGSRRSPTSTVASSPIP